MLSSSTKSHVPLARSYLLLDSRLLPAAGQERGAAMVAVMFVSVCRLYATTKQHKHNSTAANRHADIYFHPNGHKEAAPRSALRNVRNA